MTIGFSKAVGVFALLMMTATPSWAEVFQIDPGPDAEELLQEALILAEPFDVVQIAAGHYDIRNGLSLDVDNVTVMGAGMDRTVLSFANQTGGSEGLMVTGDQTLLEGFAIEDTLGDAIKVKGVDGIYIRGVRTEWTGGALATNGAYGLYPVSSTNVLIEDCVAIGASDAGIYVGQSQHIIVRNCRGEFNVAGLEIENSYYADVYDNMLTNNTAGILVFDLPNLPQTGGHHIRVFGNTTTANNTDNFAPEGNIVGIVPRGTGMLIMANRDVEIFDNDFGTQDGVNLIVGGYPEPFDDDLYNPYPARVHVHDNRFAKSGENFDEGIYSEIIARILGDDIPDVVWDGLISPLRHFTGLSLARSDRHSLQDNVHENDIPFANVNLITDAELPSWHEPKFTMRGFDGNRAPLGAATVVFRGQSYTAGE